MHVLLFGWLCSVSDWLHSLPNCIDYVVGISLVFVKSLSDYCHVVFIIMSAFDVFGLTVLCMQLVNSCRPTTSNFVVEVLQPRAWIFAQKHNDASSAVDVKQIPGSNIIIIIKPIIIETSIIHAACIDPSLFGTKYPSWLHQLTKLPHCSPAYCRSMFSQ